MKKFLSLFFIFLITNIFLFAQTPDPYEPEMIKAFADDLYQSGFTDQAESEYKRYLFTFDNTNTDTEAIFKLATIYHQTKNMDGAIWLSDKFSSVVPVELSEKLFINSAGMIFYSRNLDLFNSFTKTIRPDFSKELKLLIPISVSVLNKDLPLAKELLKTAAMEFQVFVPSEKIASSIKTKSPGLALALSIFVPGSGKWYSGSFGGFASDFLVIGGLTAGTVYTGIKSDWKDWRPYVFGTCALVFYISDLYGSYKSAERYNELQYRVLAESIDKIYEEEF